MKILARHKWVEGAVICESCNEESTVKRFTATIRGFRNWKLWEGPYGKAQSEVEKIVSKVKEIRDRIDAKDDKVFNESTEVK